MLISFKGFFKKSQKIKNFNYENFYSIHAKKNKFLTIKSFILIIFKSNNFFSI
jgi:hypothetical protein